MREILFLLPVLLTSCSITGLNYKSQIGDEFIPKDRRYSVSSGLETVFSNGTKIGATYRYRINDFEKDTSEHGTFIDINVPIWKKK